MVSSGGHQVVIPKTYLDTIEEMLPPIYLDRYSTYEIENTDATPRQKLENLKSLIDEIEAKALLKKPESKCNEDEDDENIEDDDDDDEEPYPDYEGYDSDEYEEPYPDYEGYSSDE